MRLNNHTQTYKRARRNLHVIHKRTHVKFYFVIMLNLHYFEMKNINIRAESVIKLAFSSD